MLAINLTLKKVKGWYHLIEHVRRSCMSYLNAQPLKLERTLSRLKTWPCTRSKDDVKVTAFIRWYLAVTFTSSFDLVQGQVFSLLNVLSSFNGTAFKSDMHDHLTWRYHLIKHVRWSCMSDLNAVPLKLERTLSRLKTWPCTRSKDDVKVTARYHLIKHVRWSCMSDLNAVPLKLERTLSRLKTWPCTRSKDDVKVTARYHLIKHVRWSCMSDLNAVPLKLERTLSRLKTWPCTRSKREVNIMKW